MMALTNTGDKCLPSTAEERRIVPGTVVLVGTLPSAAALEEDAADLMKRFSCIPVFLAAEHQVMFIHAYHIWALPTILRNKSLTSSCSRIGLILTSPFPNAAAALPGSPMGVDYLIRALLNNADLVALFQTNLSSCSGRILGVSYRMQIGCIISTDYFDRMVVVSVNIRSIGDNMGNPRGMLSSSSETASEFVGRRSSHPLSNIGEVGSRRQYKYVSSHDASYWERSFSHDLNLQHTGFIACGRMADEFAAWFPEQKKTGVWVVGAGWKLPRIRSRSKKGTFSSRLPSYQLAACSPSSTAGRSDPPPVRRNEPPLTRFLLDSGASMHVVGDRRLLRGLRHLPQDAARFATLPDGSRLPITGVGTVQMNGFDIPDVYLVDGVTVNLVSVGQLATNHNICCCFFRNRCQLLMLGDGTRVGEALLDDDGVYGLRFLHVPA